MRIRRFCYWLILFTLAAFIGAGVFYFVRYRPRCVFETKEERFWLLSADGSRLLTYERLDPFVKQVWRSWDTNTGQQIAEWEGNARWQRVKPSKDGRYITYSDGKLLRVIDWQAGEHWDIDIAPEISPFRITDFSTSGRWLLVRGPSTYSLVDVSARKKVAEFAQSSSPSFITATAIEDRFLAIWEGEKRAIWEIDTKKTVGTLPPLLACGDADCPVSAEGLWCSGGEVGEHTVAELEVWNAVEQKLRCRHALPSPNKGLTVAFPPNPRRIALTYERDEGAVVEMVDVDTGKSLWSLATQKNPGIDFSLDSSLVGLLHTRDEAGFVTMLDAETGRMVWELTGDSFLLAFRAGVVLKFDDANNRYCLFDSPTGIHKATVPLALDRLGAINDPKTGALTSGRVRSMPTFSADERHLVFSGNRILDREPYFWETWLDKHWPEFFSFSANHVVVMETATGRELFHVTRFGTWSADLSEDGSTLVTLDWWGDPETHHVVRIWDISPTKAYLWAIGSALTTALVSQFGVMRGLRKFRKRKAA